MFCWLSSPATQSCTYCCTLAYKFLPDDSAKSGSQRWTKRGRTADECSWHRITGWLKQSQLPQPPLPRQLTIHPHSCHTDTVVSDVGHRPCHFCVSVWHYVKSHVVGHLWDAFCVVLVTEFPLPPQLWWLATCLSPNQHCQSATSVLYSVLVDLSRCYFPKNARFACIIVTQQRAFNKLHRPLSTLVAHSCASLTGGHPARWNAVRLCNCSSRRLCDVLSACEVKAHLIGCWQYFGVVCFWQPLV